MNATFSIRALAATAVLLAGSVSSVAHAQYRYCPPCPCPTPAAAPTQPGAPTQAPGAQAPAAPGAAAQAPAQQPTPDLFAQQGQLAAAPSTFAPNMIGDFFGGAVPVPHGSSWSSYAPSPGAGVLGRHKQADNTNPMPQDRIFLDYDYYHNAVLTQRAEVNRFAPGFEKTFLDGLMSVEARFPTGSSLSNSIRSGQPIGYENQFGNIPITFKTILMQDDCQTWTLSGGLGVSCPTAPRVDVYNAAGTILQARIENESVHLLPFFGLYVQPDECWFGMAYIQVDVDANGNSVYGNTATAGPATLVRAGRLMDRSLIYVDGAVGRWLYRDNCRRVSGVAAIFEAHYTGGLNSPSSVTANGVAFGDPTNRLSILDLTVGGLVTIGKSSITCGYGTPVTSDRGFDGEMRVFFNRFF